MNETNPKKGAHRERKLSIKIEASPPLHDGLLVVKCEINNLADVFKLI